MHLTRAFRHAGRFPAVLFASALLLASSCAHVRAQPAPASATLGEQKTAVILVNFADAPTQPKTKAELHGLVFGQVSDFFWENSYQKVLLSGDTFGWFTIPVGSSTCDTTSIAREANLAATAAGASLEAYSQVIYMFPHNSGCGWSGTLNVGARGEGQIFINSAFNYQNIAHELGHLYGLQHSDSIDCGASALGSNCVQQSYGDQADTMGNRGAHFNAFQKERLGWLNAAGAPAITTVSGSGRYAIAPYTTSQGAKALKILKHTDPTTGQKTWYYIEYRQATGFDSVLVSDGGNLANGILIRTGTVAANGFGTSLLLDMTPESTGIEAFDVLDGALEVGRSYSDAASGVTITLAAADANGATIDVSFGGGNPPPTCTRSAPTLSLSGPTAAIAAGSTANYTLSLSNKDSSACAATTFNLARSIPSGWTGTLAASTLSLTPGASGSTTLTVTSPTSATAGNYGLGVGASSSVGSVHTANGSTTYSVATAPSSGTLTETVGTDKTSYLRGQTVYMSALVRNNGVPVHGASVKFTVSLPGGVSTIVSATSGSDGYARSTYKLGKGKGAMGSYALRADASSGGNTASASASFSVN